MMKDSGSFGGQGVNVWLIAGWAILVLFGIGIIVAGLILFRGGQPQAEATQPVPTATSTPVVLPTVVPTHTPLPTATFMPPTSILPTAVPATATTPAAMVEASDKGVNVRSGPGTSFEEIGRLEPGQKAAVTGRYGDWWQIDYGGTPGWVADWVVTPYNTDSVAEVEPPASPIPSTAAPIPTKTPIPATPAPAECRGVVGDSFQVEGAPGPYPAGGEIKFHMWVTNKTGSDIEYKSLGVAVEETGQYQNSYSWSKLYANKQFYHQDHISIEQPGTYHLWLTIGFLDEYWCRLAGPVEVIIQ